VGRGNADYRTALKLDRRLKDARDGVRRAVASQRKAQTTSYQEQGMADQNPAAPEREAGRQEQAAREAAGTDLETASGGEGPGHAATSADQTDAPDAAMVAAEIREAVDEEQLIRGREYERRRRAAIAAAHRRRAAAIAAQQRRCYITQQQYYAPRRNPSFVDAFDVRR